MLFFDKFELWNGIYPFYRRIYFYFMIIEGSLSHKIKLIDEIQILSLFEHFKVTGAILPLHTGAILPPLQNGRQSIVFGLI